MTTAYMDGCLGGFDFEEISWNPETWNPDAMASGAFLQKLTKRAMNLKSFPLSKWMTTKGKIVEAQEVYLKEISASEPVPPMGGDARRDLTCSMEFHMALQEILEGMQEAHSSTSGVERLRDAAGKSGGTSSKTAAGTQQAPSPPPARERFGDGRERGGDGVGRGRQRGKELPGNGEVPCTLRGLGAVN
jgi:hypothetical protein